MHITFKIRWVLVFSQPKNVNKRWSCSRPHYGKSVLDFDTQYDMEQFLILIDFSNAWFTSPGVSMGLNLSWYLLDKVKWRRVSTFLNRNMGPKKCKLNDHPYAIETRKTIKCFNKKWIFVMVCVCFILFYWKHTTEQ